MPVDPRLREARLRPRVEGDEPEQKRQDGQKEQEAAEEFHETGGVLGPEGFERVPCVARANYGGPEWGQPVTGYIEASQRVEFVTCNRQTRIALSRNVAVEFGNRTGWAGRSARGRNRD